MLQYLSCCEGPSGEPRTSVFQEAVATWTITRTVSQSRVIHCQVRAGALGAERRGVQPGVLGGDGSRGFPRGRDIKAESQRRSKMGERSVSEKRN